MIVTVTITSEIEVPDGATDAEIVEFIYADPHGTILDRNDMRIEPNEEERKEGR